MRALSKLLLLFLAYVEALVTGFMRSMKVGSTRAKSLDWQVSVHGNVTCLTEVRGELKR